MGQTLICQQKLNFYKKKNPPKFFKNPKLQTSLYALVW